MVHALRSRRVITPHGEVDDAVLIDAEHIAAIKPLSELSANIPVEDLGALALLPGLVDAHTHINEPGRTDWEGFATATRAAAAGGF
ncbi:MAG: allantoinase, partial [Acidobacteriaceae bacterium]